MSKDRPEELSSLKQLTKEQVRRVGWGAIYMGVMAKTPESMALLELLQMMREIHHSSREASRQQLRLRYCLYSILAIVIVMSAVLSVVFCCLLSMPTIGLSFVGPLSTGILGLVVVLVSERRK